MVFSVVSKECVCSLRCCANLEQELLTRNACMCSLYLTAKFILSVPHKLSYKHGLSICILWKRICLGYGSYVSDDYVCCFCTVSYSEVCLSEYVGDVRSFLTYVSKHDPFVFGCGWGLLFRSEAGRFFVV
jgi:hypothetical protein